jgi:ComF family protein
VDPFRGILCARCGYGFPSPNIHSARPLCGGCRRSLFLFDFARAYSSFEEPLKEIIHQFKYRSHPSLARPLARLLLSVYRSNLAELSSDLIIPVPLHKLRERERGFNQAFELSRQFSRLTCIPLPTGLLVRTKPTKVQAGLSRRQRRLNLRGAFEVSRSGMIRDKTLLLIDDVFTTGATLNECAKILKDHGARRINVLTLARVIRG